MAGPAERRETAVLRLSFDHQKEAAPMKRMLVLACIAASLVLSGPGGAQEDADERWLATLITDTPEEGFELAVRLARRGVVVTQPDVEVLRRLRPAYAHDPDSLIAVSHVVAVYFQTIAAANDYWRAEQ
jgi:hypothetical protein